MIISGWQNYLIRTNNVVSQRAFVSFAFQAGVSAWGPTPKSFSINDIQDALSHGADPKAVTFVVDIANGGNTGTKNLTFLVRCVSSTEDLKDPWGLLYQGKNIPPKVPQFIGPHTTLHTACAFPIDQIRAMLAGTLFGFVLIDTTYQDRLTDDWHRTEATTKVAQIGAMPGTEPGGSTSMNYTAVLAVYGDHNCADEECPSN